MGILFSRGGGRQHEQTELLDISPGCHRVGTKRKKPDDNDQLNGTAHGVQTSQAPKYVEDDTPDGDMHRYIVRCKTIYWCTRKDIQKILAKLEMPPYGGLHKITKWEYFFITFPNKNCAKKGVACLSSYSYRGEKWDVSQPTDHSAKRVRVDGNISRSREKSELTMPDGVCLSAADMTAKWRNVLYTEQIERKRRKWLNALRLVTKKLKKEVRDVSRIQWLDDATKEAVGKAVPACCSLENIITAESEQAKMHYRNKNEFTIGMSPDSCGMNHAHHKSELAIGYALGLVRDGQVFIGEVDSRCHTTSRTAIGIAKCLTPVIRSLNMPSYDKRTHEGYWRQITCREGSRTGQVIVSVAVNMFCGADAGEKDSEFERNDEYCRSAVVKALSEHFGTQRQFGVFWQPSDRISTVTSDTPAVHLHGIKTVEEEMCGLKFRIQPNAFFQVNTIMAERLYELIGDVAKIDAGTVVFDVCCGTGTIGLSLAKRAHSVVGIEMNESAVADAEHNAYLNDIQNTTFIHGKVEDRIHDAIKQIDSERECVVILDPPRAGLPMNVVSAVRAMRAVRRIVYVACEPNNFWKNALGFCRPRSKAFRLDPFHPVKAWGVDLFPHTDHGELVVLLERDTVDETGRQPAEKV